MFPDSMSQSHLWDFVRYLDRGCDTHGHNFLLKKNQKSCRCVEGWDLECRGWETWRGRDLMMTMTMTMKSDEETAQVMLTTWCIFVLTNVAGGRQVAIMSSDDHGYGSISCCHTHKAPRMTYDLRRMIRIVPIHGHKDERSQQEQNDNDERSAHASIMCRTLTQWSSAFVGDELLPRSRTKASMLQDKKQTILWERDDVFAVVTRRPCVHKITVWVVPSYPEVYKRFKISFMWLIQRGAQSRLINDRRTSTEHHLQ